MCGRFTLAANLDTLGLTFPGVNIPANLQPRYNIAPTQGVVAIGNSRSHQIDYFHWGLIPSWAKDRQIGYRMINARSETLAEKPSFKGPLRYKRCLILSDGFYEWYKTPGAKTKTPVYIQLKSKQPFAFAGLWDEWQGSEGEDINSCTIVTCAANDFVSKIHDRMPVIMKQEYYDDWLELKPQPPDKLLPLLKSYPSEEMAAYVVSPLVNKPQNDSVNCTEQVCDLQTILE